MVICFWIQIGVLLSNDWEWECGWEMVNRKTNGAPFPGDDIGHHIADWAIHSQLGTCSFFLAGWVKGIILRHFYIGTF